MHAAVDAIGELLGLAIMPYFIGALFAVFGRGVYEAANAPGSSPWRQIAHFWVAGFVIWAIATGKLPLGSSDGEWAYR